MRFRPNRAELIEGMVKVLTFNLTPVVGANSINGTPTIEAEGLTFTDIAADGLNLTVTVSGGEADRDYVATVTASFSSGETEVGSVTLEWKKPGYDARSAS